MGNLKVTSLANFETGSITITGGIHRQQLKLKVDIAIMRVHVLIIFFFFRILRLIINSECFVPRVAHVFSFRSQKGVQT